MSQQETRLPNFGFRYAVPMGKQHNFEFHSASDLYNHVQRNRPGLFAGIPKLEDENYDEKMSQLRSGSYVMPNNEK